MKFWPRKKVDFKDIIDIPDWQKMQDVFSEVTSIGLRTLDPEGRLLTAVSGQTRLCAEFYKNHSQGSEQRSAMQPTFLGGKGQVDKNFSFICPPGFHNFFAPLRIDNRVVAYLIMGPVILVMRKPKDQYQALADQLDVELDELWKAVMEIRVISFHRAQTLIQLIGKISEFVLNLAYESKEQGSKLFTAFADKFQGVLEVFLELALQISGADIGSIMLLDKNKEAMTIRASKGLPDSVIKNTRIHMGSGICGTAAQENKPIIIDDTVSDNRIRQYMHRPYLKSSMILPIDAEDKVYGVLNLGALEVSSVRFNKEDMDSMHQVIDLTLDALYTPVKSAIKSKAEYLDHLL